MVTTAAAKVLITSTTGCSDCGIAVMVRGKGRLDGRRRDATNAAHGRRPAPLRGRRRGHRQPRLGRGHGRPPFSRTEPRRPPPLPKTRLRPAPHLPDEIAAVTRLVLDEAAVALPFLFPPDKTSGGSPFLGGHPPLHPSRTRP